VICGSPDPLSSSAFLRKMSNEIRAAFLAVPEFYSLHKSGRD